MPKAGRNIYKRKDGRWEGRYIKGYNESGKAVYGFVYAKTYKNVKHKLLTAQSGVLLNRSTSDNKLTFADVSQKWLLKTSLTVKQSTYARYAYVLGKHILPTLGGYRLHKLTTDDIDRFTQGKLTSGRADKKGGLSPKTVRDILTMVKSIIGFAEKEKLMVKSGLTVTYPKGKPPETRVISRQEQEILEKYLYANLNSAEFGVLLSLYTGLRIGEICALQWGDISLSKQIISVNRTMQRVKNTDSEAETKTRILTDTPKSKYSLRDIPVPNFIMADIIKFAPKPYNANAYFLTGRSDSFTEPRAYQEFFAKCVKSSGITPINYHGTRHTFATRCIEAGVDVKSLSQILGHANVNITLNRYVHPSFEQKRQNMMKLERISKD